MPTGIYKRTEYHKRRLSEARLKRKEKFGYINSPEARKKISQGVKDFYKNNPQAREILSEAKKGNKNPAKKLEVRQKLRELNLGKNNPNYGKPRSIKSRKKVSASHQGIKLEEWTHFTSFEPYGPEFNDTIKKKIRKRYNYICQLCGDKIIKQKLRKFLCIHHIDFNKKNNSEENLTPLCNFCNTSVNKSREEWTDYFQNRINIFK